MFLEDDNIEVSLTPLIDTVLVLLIVFILVSPHLDEALKIYLPSSKSSVLVEKENTFCFAVNQHGKIFLKNRTAVALNELIRELKVYKNDHSKGEKKVVLFADKDLLLHQITEIVDAIYAIGITNVYIKTKKINF